MKKEKIEALIKNALKESTFVHRIDGEVSLVTSEEISIFLHPEFESGIDLDEGENKVYFNFTARFITTSTGDCNGSSCISSHNYVATMSRDSAEIQQPVRIG
jgi:hypothetical protein